MNLGSATILRADAGCCWNELTRIQDAAKALLDAEASDGA